MAGRSLRKLEAAGHKSSRTDLLRQSNIAGHQPHARARQLLCKLDLRLRKRRLLPMSDEGIRRTDCVLPAEKTPRSARKTLAGGFQRQRGAEEGQERRRGRAVDASGGQAGRSQQEERRRGSVQHQDRHRAEVQIVRLGEAAGG